MSGEQVRAVRKKLQLSQLEAARRWKVSQPYLSLMEHGHRRVPDRLARRLVVEGELRLATALPLKSVVDVEDLPVLLGTLGYPGFAYLGDPKRATNPAAVLLASLKAPFLPARVTEALPWLLVTFASLDWGWLLDQVKLSNVQNRLGYLVELARDVANSKGETAVASKLDDVQGRLEESRLAKEDSLGRHLTEVERQRLREHRPESAAHWNLLTNLKSSDLRYAV